MSMRGRIILLVVSVSALAACATTSNRAEPCNQSVTNYGLSLTVKSDSGDPICDARVVARDGSHEETLERIQLDDSCAYAGALERPGKYRLGIERDGYRSAVLDEIAVTRDTCHVVPELRQVALQKL